MMAGLTTRNWAYVLGCCAGLLLTQDTVAHASAVPKIKMGSALRPRKFALVIGINTTQKSKYWNPLRYARKDAKRMAEALRRNAQFDRIALHNTPARTTTKALKQAFRNLLSWVKSPDDTVLVYISSHGTVSRGRKRFLVSSDTTRKIALTGLPVEWIRKQLRKLRSRKIGLILAACYTGSSQSKSVKVPGYKGSNKPMRPIRRDRAIQILSAASFAQPAFESNQFKSDVYTHYFLECFHKLSQKSIIKIHVCAAYKTTPYVQKLNHEIQVPKAYSELGANRDFFLVSPGGKNPSQGYFRAPIWLGKAMKYELFRMGRKSSKSNVVKVQEGEWTALPPGRYQVQVRDEKQRVVRVEELVIQPSEVTRFPSDWSLEVQGGLWGSSGWLQQGGEMYGSAMFGIRHRYFAVFLGAWGTQLSFEQDPYTQLGIQARVEGGYSHKWGMFALFAGAYVSAGVLLQDINQGTLPALALQGGATLTPSLWLHPQWALFVSVDGGVIPSLVNTRWNVSWVGSVRAGFRFRFSQ